MNRRDFIRLSLAASATALLPACVAPWSRTSRHPHPKRGLGMSTKDPAWRAKLQAVNVNWFYNWGPDLPVNAPDGIEFVPMVFRAKAGDPLTRVSEKIKLQKSKYLLGLNEPDTPKQGNMTVEQALAVWPKLMALGVPLVSPACVHPDKDWMKAFMKGVEERSLRVDFVAVHSYGGPNADALMQRLEAVHALYRRPLWITEFGVGDWKAKTRAENIHSPERVQAFMTELLPRLDACAFLQRYAWFAARPSSPSLGSCALFNDDGSLTRLGEIYQSV